MILAPTASWRDDLDTRTGRVLYRPVTRRACVTSSDCSQPISRFAARGGAHAGASYLATRQWEKALTALNRDRAGSRPWMGRASALAGLGRAGEAWGELDSLLAAPDTVRSWSTVSSICRR